ncbi:MAG: Trm112 family protein [Pseudonocardiales bacterium]|jgi:uncharacterized protein YbaR (Trm112 family)|nr:Trm112 family protein [Pseudonocardiales bacterium]MBV9652663.1 Trm112 family protein [Pseudonocardiales bacterium]
MVVGLDPQLMEILACPCPQHGKLSSGTAANPEADALTCATCGRSFPVVDGIPVLLLTEALPGTGPEPDQVDGGPGRRREPGSG